MPILIKSEHLVVMKFIIWTWKITYRKVGNKYNFLIFAGPLRIGIWKRKDWLA